MKRALVLALVLALGLMLSGCSDSQVLDALIDMGYAPADASQSPTPQPSLTPAPSPTPDIITLSPSPSATPTLSPAPSLTPTPNPENVELVTGGVTRISGNPKSIKLDKGRITLFVGQSRKLKATVKPKKNTIKKVSWISDDVSIAIVNKKGKITALSEGITIVTCETVNGLRAECEITVVSGNQNQHKVNS